MENEDKLIGEALRGDANSLETLLRPYRQGMLTTAFRMTGNMEDAKEICQETVIKVMKYLKSFKKGRSFSNWLLKTVVNISYDFLKKRARFDQVESDLDKFPGEQALDPEKRFLNREIKEKIEMCLRFLSPKEKAVFLLRDGEGLSIIETSEVLECSSLSVRTHLSRARNKIRLQFAKIYSHPEIEVDHEV